MSSVLDLIDNLPRRPAAIVIRHAARFDIKGNDAHFSTGLTENGLADAFEFGAALSNKFDNYRLFYSKAKRCRQTAERICDALVLAGKDARIIGEEDVIGVSYMLADIDTAFDEFERHGNKFIRTWFDGGLEPGIYKPLADTLSQHLDYLRSSLASSPGLDIHVSHDWNINVLREGIFKLKHEDVGWPEFLSGVVFSLDQDGLTAAVENNGDLIQTLLQ